MASDSDISDLRLSFSDISKYCTETESKHESKAYKYFKEKYVHSVKGKPK